MSDWKVTCTSSQFSRHRMLESIVYLVAQVSWSSLKDETESRLHDLWKVIYDSKRSWTTHCILLSTT